MLRNPSTYALVVALLGGAVVGCASPALDANLDPPAGEQLLMTVAAHGAQIYECRSAQGAAPAWAFVAPEADLFDAEGRRIGGHGAGPSWKHVDGSGFTGTVRARADAPKPRAIPWLLLSAQPQGPSGVFSRVTSVQRVNTVAGQAPSDGCAASTAGTRVQMAYRADYVLYARAPQSGAPPTKSAP